MCYNCNEMGHLAFQCPKPKKQQQQQQQPSLREKMVALLAQVEAHRGQYSGGPSGMRAHAALVQALTDIDHHEMRAADYWKNAVTM